MSKSTPTAPKVEVRVSTATDVEVTWPDGWPVPSVGDLVHLPDGVALTVTYVNWFPDGDDSDDSEPYVYVVLG